MFALIDIVFQLLYLVLFARVLLSWLPHDRYHPIIEKVYQITDPMLEPFQKLVPPGRMGFDISPIFAFIALSLIRRLLFQLL